MMDELPILLYTTPEGAVKVKAVLKDETMWLTQADMADLFDVAPQNITYHLKKIYASGELSEAATCKEILQVQNEGAREIARNLVFTMKEFAESVNKFLSFNEYKILVGAGKVPRGVADEKAEHEYDIFNRTQPVFSDFDAEIKRITDESSCRQ